MVEIAERPSPAAGAVIYRFSDLELDLARSELRRLGEAVAVEPQVFALLVLLVENRERLVTRDEILEKVWDGRVVSDAAISSRVKSARRAVGDDGVRQAVVRTVHGRGFRFVAPVVEAASQGAASVAAVAAPIVDATSRANAATPTATRPSIAVLPFSWSGDDDAFATVAEALPHELIAELSRLRWLFVIARGSSFRFRSPSPDFDEVGRALGVRYCLAGHVEVSGRSLAATVELVATDGAVVVWADRFESTLEGVHETRRRILARVVAALEVRIPDHEAALARLATPESLDAWASYHLGLQHALRFNRPDNAAAAAFFERAAALDPRFARAWAGLSFVHFQNAFLRYRSDRAEDVRLARSCSERAVELDALDPFVNFTMGRSYWLEGDLGASLGWIERATSISPNYAHGVYATAWTHALSGRGREGREAADLAMALSPLDPLHYAMAATRAFAHSVGGEDDEAALWADRAARSPGAHVLIAAVAAATAAMRGDDRGASSWAASVRRRAPGLDRREFFVAFPFADAALHRRLDAALARLGF